MSTINRASAHVRIGLALIVCFSCQKPLTRTQNPPTPTASAIAEKPTLNYFNAEPTIIAAGQSSSLRWSVDHATKLQILPEIGSVEPSDRRDISPAETTTYILTASNVAGSIEASVTVTVNRPAPASSEDEGREGGISVVNGRLRDVHFDYNQGDINDQERSILEADARLLRDLFQLDARARVTIEGHCDERGSDEFNFALGDRRASAVRDVLVRMGVPGDRLDIISYGKERPLCDSATEDCYARNRRAHFSASNARRTHEATTQQ